MKEFDSGIFFFKSKISECFLWAEEKANREGKVEDTGEGGDNVCVGGGL